jgi:hypothetical protein
MQTFGAAYAYMVCWTPQGMSIFYVESCPHFWRQVRFRAVCLSNCLTSGLDTTAWASALHDTNAG